MHVKFRIIADTHDILDKPPKWEIWNVRINEDRLNRLFDVFDRDGSIEYFYRYTHKEVIKIIGLCT